MRTVMTLFLGFYRCEKEMCLIVLNVQLLCASNIQIFTWRKYQIKSSQRLFL